MGGVAEAGTQCGGSIMGYSQGSTFQQSPRHVVHGTAQGLFSGANVLARGITGIITRPIKGAMDEGVKGAAKGFGQGTGDLWWWWWLVVVVVGGGGWWWWLWLWLWLG